MVALNPPVCDFGWKAKEFSLQNIDGKTYNLEAIKGEKGTLIMFICNHCPFVQSIVSKLVTDCKILQEQCGIGVAAIMSNDTVAYPEDSFENMKKFAANNGFSFPYLFDETQEIAKNYDAVCTPDFFGFNSELGLQYRGRFDSAGMRQIEDSEHDLLKAMQLVSETQKGPEDQTPSIGCSIKWAA